MPLILGLTGTTALLRGSVPLLEVRVQAVSGCAGISTSSLSKVNRTCPLGYPENQPHEGHRHLLRLILAAQFPLRVTTHSAEHD